jgi:hypothetical protein
MKADAVMRVTDALRARLAAALANSGVPGSVFVGPLDDADASGAALILFLYRVVPNPNLRNQEHRVASTGSSPVTVYRNSLPLDLYFLVTVGTTPGASEQAPLRALGWAMQQLHAAPDLTGAGVGQETVRVTLEPLTTEDASRIWALFPTANYRTSVAYLASPVWLDPEKLEADAGPVVEDVLRDAPQAQGAPS